MKNSEQEFSENLSITSRHESQSSKSVIEYSDPILVDLLIDIFSRVPGTSIARFRCVSKFWASILRRPDFTELFLTKSLTHPRLLFTVKANDKLFFYYSPQNQDENSCLVATRYITSFPGYFPSPYRIQQVCGLVLLQEWRRRKVPVICNPATGEFLTLPKVKANPMKISRIYLGYDPISKQFKMLCMTSSRDERSNTHQVLTLETGKCLWRTIEHKFHFIENGRLIGEVCIIGVLYFGARFGPSSVIVSFDVRSEKFGFIDTNEDIGGSLTLFNYNGKLGIHDRGRKFGHSDQLVLWVLEDAGNHKWSKHVYVLPLSVYHNRFVGVTSTGEPVWLSCKEYLSKLFYVFFYNFERKTITRVSIQGFEESKHDYRILDTFVDYVENMKFM